MDRPAEQTAGPHPEGAGPGPGNPYEPPGTGGRGLATTGTRWALSIFAVLFLMHLLDYLDRWALTGVLPRIQRDLQLSDFPSGALNFFFLLTLSVVGPAVGWAGDRVKRTWLLAAGVGIWSIATVGTGLVRNYPQLAAARLVLGIGEGTYGVLAPTILADLFRREWRARAMSAFYMAMPLGYALGVFGSGWIARTSEAMLAGTALEPWAGWRMAFFVVGVPGLLAAIAALFLPEPRRGASEDTGHGTGELARATAADYKDLMVNSSYTYVVAGMAAFTFAFGGLAFWLPTYLQAVKDFSETRATLIVGGVGLPATLVGMGLGGYLADRLSRSDVRALFWVPGTAMLLSIPFVTIGLLSDRAGVIIPMIFLAEVLMFMNTGPSNAVIANVVTPNLRGVAFAVSIFSIHVLGDLWSPGLMGLVSDYFGHPDAMDTWYGDLLARAGAVPVDAPDGSRRNLTAGMFVVVPAIALGGVVLLAGARHLPREMALMQAKLRTASRPRPGGPVEGMPDPR